jgi:lipid II:glycine glycyltransferase (peptidoglycan interpeptide bridge formation enzyme)
LLKRFHPKHRYEIKKAQKFDYQLVFPDAEELHKLLASNSIDNPNYTYPSLNRLTSLQQSLGDQASIFGIRSAGELVASALIISDHLQGYYVYGGSRKGSVGWMHLLQWEILQIMGRKGIKNYDLVGLRPPEGEDPKYEGLAKFKTRFSPDVINGYTFWVPISPFKVALFRSLLRVRKILTGHEFTL